MVLKHAVPNVCLPARSNITSGARQTCEAGAELRSTWVSLKEKEAEAKEKVPEKLEFFPGQTFQLEVGVKGQGTKVAQSEGQEVDMEKKQGLAKKIPCNPSFKMMTRYYFILFYYGSIIILNTG